MEIESRWKSDFRGESNIKYNIIKMIVCQMTKYLIFQTDRCYIVVLIVKRNRWKGGCG